MLHHLALLRTDLYKEASPALSEAFLHLLYSDLMRLSSRRSYSEEVQAFLNRFRVNVRAMLDRVENEALPATPTPTSLNYFPPSPPLAPAP
jgi:hypothetical protein